MTYGTDMSIEQRVAKIDLVCVMKRLKSEMGLSDADCARAETLYRQFLVLIAKYPGRFFVAPHIADEVWHNHVLFTKKYAEDCEMMFGKFLHHYPAEDEDEDMQKPYAATVALYQSEFGVHPAHYGLSREEFAFAARSGGNC